MASGNKLTEGKEKNTFTKSQFSEIFESISVPTVGEIVTGKIVHITDEGNYLVAVTGIKSEVLMDSSESDSKLNIGDTVEGAITSDNKGHFRIKKRFMHDDAKVEEYERKQETREPILGEIITLVTKKVKKDNDKEVDVPCGFDVKIDEKYTGFCPYSKFDISKIDNPEDFYGKKDYFVIEKFSSNPRTKSILNRRCLLQAQVDANKKEFFDSVNVGDVVEGTVKNLTSFGAFVDLGGFDGLLHINDMSWGHPTKPDNFVKSGDTLRLRVLSIDPQNSRINLSLKDMTTNPWSTFAQKYSVGQVIKGKVMRCTTFGVFIEIEPSIEGLAHVSELSWSHRTVKPSDMFHPGDIVEAKILGYDTENQRVSLGIKELQENPWDNLAQKFPAGTKLKAKAVKVTQTGAFFRLDENLDGFLAANDISWSDKITDVRDYIKSGDEKELMVVSIDPAHQRIRLSIKALEENPWQVFKDNYAKGSKVVGKVSEVSDKGVHVKINDDIIGFINKPNLVLEDGQNISDAYKVGDEIASLITSLDIKSKKLLLSAKALKAKDELGDWEKYMSSDDNSGDTSFTLGDILK